MEEKGRAARQSPRVGVVRSVARYWHTAKYLKLVQVQNRIWRRIKLLHVRPERRPPPCREIGRDANSFLPRSVSIVGHHRFRLLNIEAPLTFPADWGAPSHSRLWGYNLHYFEGLNHPETDEALKEALVETWIAHNRPGMRPGWEPYPLSLRIVNWVKWSIHRAEGHAAVDASLALQVRYLEQVLEYHLLGNHLLANAKALVFAGLYFRGAEADRWYGRGMRILLRQLQEQILEDGGHFELSPMYHCLVTEDILDLIQIHRLAGSTVAPELTQTATRALGWLSVMTREDGLPPQFNDCAYGEFRTFEELCEYGRRFDVVGPDPGAAGLTQLSPSGYVRIVEQSYSAYVDVGQMGPDYLPGHAHCDMLSFELMASGHPIIVDTGTSTYEPGQRRLVERGTGAHNTVQLGSIEQSEIWSSFRVARRARMLNVRADSTSLSASASVAPPHRVRHERSFTLQSNGLTIRDFLRGKPESLPAIARFHFHPDESVVREDQAVSTRHARLVFSGTEQVRIRPYEYACGFNRIRAGLVVEVPFEHCLTTEVRV